MTTLVHLLGQLRRGPVALLLQQRAGVLLARFVEFSGHAAAMRTRHHLAGGAQLPEIILHGVGGDVEPLGQLPDTFFTVLVGGDDPPPEVEAIRFHPPAKSNGDATAPLDRARLVASPPANRSSSALQKFGQGWPNF